MKKTGRDIVKIALNEANNLKHKDLKSLNLVPLKNYVSANYDFLHWHYFLYDNDKKLETKPVFLNDNNFQHKVLIWLIF